MPPVVTVEPVPGTGVPVRSDDRLRGLCLSRGTARPAGRQRHRGRRERDQRGKTGNQAAAGSGTWNTHTPTVREGPQNRLSRA